MSQTQTSFPRWLPLLGGLLGSTTCGLLLYAFSVFIKPLMAEFGWGQTEVLLSYSIICLVFGLITFPAGRLSDKFGPRNVVLIGGIVMAAGFFLVSTLTPPDATLNAASKEANKAFFTAGQASTQTKEIYQAAIELRAAKIALEKLEAKNDANNIAEASQKVQQADQNLQQLAMASPEASQAVLSAFEKAEAARITLYKEGLIGKAEAAKTDDERTQAAEALKKENRTSLYLLYVFYGLIAGFGGGCVYLPPIATAPKWWPDRRAMATGLTVVGLGLGSFVMGPLAGGMIESAGGTALPVFKYVGIAMAILVVISALCLKNPPAGYKPAGWNPPAPATQAGESAKAYRDYTYEEAKKTAQFWLLWIAYFCGSFAGLLVISTLAKIGADGMTAAGTMTTAEITKYAAWLPSALAVSNAATRVLIGPVADKIGTRKIFIALFALQTVAVLALYPASATFAIAAVVAVIIGWNYGAMFTLFPATTLSYYGSSSQGSNYGLLFTAWGIAGFFGPFAGSKVFEWTGTWLVPCAISAALLAVAVIILVAMKPPEKKTV